jgi:hypothetical protein
MYHIKNKKYVILLLYFCIRTAFMFWYTLCKSHAIEELFFVEGEEINKYCQGILGLLSSIYMPVWWSFIVKEFLGLTG